MRDSDDFWAPRTSTADHKALHWVSQRFFGITALVFAAIGQLVLLAAILVFPAPDTPIYKRPLESYWAEDTAPDWWIFSTVLALVLALVGLIADKRRGTAAVALLVAFVGFVWPWG